MPTENLDKTKHQKIFVLNNSISDNSFENIISKITSRREELVNESSVKVKRVLSNILDDYNPQQNISENFTVQKNEAEA